MPVSCKRVSMACEVVVIDDDLGRSGGGTARPGFEKLLAAIREVRVGAVVSIEASQLARNGRDWHTLLEFLSRLGRHLLAVGLERPLHRPETCDDAKLAGQLLSHDIGVAAMAPQPFAQPILLPAEELGPRRLLSNGCQPPAPR